MMLPLWLLLLALGAVGIGALTDHVIQERRDCAHVTQNLVAMHRFLESHPLTLREIREVVLWREKLLKERVEHCGPLEDQYEEPKE